jgi:hypothetical protein
VSLQALRASQKSKEQFGCFEAIAVIWILNIVLLFLFRGTASGMMGFFLGPLVWFVKI